jgi:hypothetical protein
VSSSSRAATKAGPVRSVAGPRPRLDRPGHDRPATSVGRRPFSVPRSTAMERSALARAVPGARRPGVNAKAAKRSRADTVPLELVDQLAQPGRGRRRVGPRSTTSPKRRTRGSPSSAAGYRGDPLAVNG